MEPQINADKRELPEDQFIRSMLGILGLVSVLVLIGLPQVTRAGDALPDARYTLFVELQPPYASNRIALQKMLKAEGYESFPEGEREVVLILTEAQIGKLFQARIRYRKIMASSEAGLREAPYLEGATIPARYEKLMRRVYFDSQRS